MKRVAEVAPNLPMDRALDFGCGVGRVTRALAVYFKEVRGVDISETMVKLAQQYNQRFNNCSFYHNARTDLSLFPSKSFSFVYSSIVLQHIPPAYSKNYIREFIRILADGGLAVFQVPSELIPKFGLQSDSHLRRRMGRSLLRRPVSEMHGISREEVIRVIETARGLVVAVDDNDYSGPEWRSFLYYVSKKKMKGVQETRYSNSKDL